MKRLIFMCLAVISLALVGCKDDSESEKTETEILQDYMSVRYVGYSVESMQVYDNLPNPYGVMVGWSIGSPREPEVSRVEKYLFEDFLEKWDNTDNWKTSKAIKAYIRNDKEAYTEYFFFDIFNKRIENTLSNMRVMFNYYSH